MLCNARHFDYVFGTYLQQILQIAKKQVELHLCTNMKKKKKLHCSSPVASVDLIHLRDLSSSLQLLIQLAPAYLE